MAAWLLSRALSGRSGGLLPWSRVCCRERCRMAPSVLQDKPRKASDLPRVRVWEMLYRMLFQGYYNRLHELQLYEKQLYGPIYWSGMKSVSVNTAELLEELLRKDEKFPSRGDMSLWTEYRDMRGLGYGPFTE